MFPPFFFRPPSGSPRLAGGETRRNLLLDQRASHRQPKPKPRCHVQGLSLVRQQMQVDDARFDAGDEVVQIEVFVGGVGVFAVEAEAHQDHRTA